MISKVDIVALLWTIGTCVSLYLLLGSLGAMFYYYFVGWQVNRRAKRDMYNNARSEIANI